ncbi:MAG: branched-chain amino acid ABC transporter permease [Burkholderiaceae bacterium]
MDAQIAAWLAQDGLTNGAIYCLLGLATVLVFAVTRVIFVPQGEFVTFGALTLAMLRSETVPGSAWLVMVVAAAVAVVDLITALRGRDAAGLPARLARSLGVPVAAAALVVLLAPRDLPLAVDVLLTLVLITPLGPLLYRLVYQPLVDASVLVLLIASVALHFALTGLALTFFGPEGFRTPAFSDAMIDIGSLGVSGQSLWIFGITLALIVAMAWGFGRTLYGKALRATAFNRVGARLIGFSPVSAGLITFAAAAFIGTLSGVLIGPIVTIYYDSGFIIGLKGFVAAIIGGLASYPLTGVGAVLVGMLESFASFWASSYKEVIVFTAIIPVLIFLSLKAGHHEQEDEQ